jgi:hypothetical protein
LRYHVYVEAEPTLESYRLSHDPRNGYSPVFICPFVVLTDADGNLYNAMRGIQGQHKGAAHNYNVYKLNGVLDEQCPMVYPWKEVPVSEPYWVAEDRDAVSYIGSTFRFDFGVDRYRGTIDGTPVEGLFMLDYIYSRPDAMWTEMGMLTKLHNLWLNWLVEYEDGSLEGGYAWRGRPGNGFAAAHHYVGGVSTARSDAVLTTARTERGTVSGVELRLGDLVVDLEQHGSCDWPLHTCGTVRAISGGRGAIAKSWNYTEAFPLNWWAVADYQAAHKALFGTYPSFQRLMRGARVDEDQMLVFDQPRARS